MAQEKAETIALDVSVRRVRVGIILLALFWLPIWLLAPFWANHTGITVGQATLEVGAAQTVLGVAGFIIVGKQSVKIVSQTSKRQLPKIVWHIFWTGKV